MSWSILTVAILAEPDVVAARQRARRIAEMLGFERQDQTRIATAVSEIARNAFGYAGGGRVEFLLDHAGSPQTFLTRISDRGKGIKNLDAVLEGRYRSETGMGLGITGARRLVDRFEIETSPESGTRVTLAKMLPRRAPIVSREMLGDVAAQLAKEGAGEPLAEIREQNQELMRSLAELQSRQDELATLNRELEDTNRGVVALYAELDEKAEQLRQASELKSRFLSNISHEFRTPLNSILALSRLLLDQVDGVLTDEQERQVSYIRKSAQSLTDLVNDLLDIAKVEAGKIDVRPVAFTVEELFGGLRGSLRPLQTSDSVELVFEEPRRLPNLETDEAKVSQILRNFISNALKFTEAGEVNVSASYDAVFGRVSFVVRDTGIGIAPEHQARIFEEFVQVENRLQGRVKGTGLGLPLSKKLAELLGGSVHLESRPGSGSIFTLTIPARFGVFPLAEGRGLEPGDAGHPRRRVLVIDDEEAFRYVMRHLISHSTYEVIEAADGMDGLLKARDSRPDVIVLDLKMPKLDGYTVMNELGADPATRDIAVIVSTSSEIGPEEHLRLTRARAILNKNSLSRESVSSLLRAVTSARGEA
jgi:signal transduction histidine kinase